MVAREASEASEASDLYDSEPDFDDDILVARKGELQEVGPLCCERRGLLSCVA